MACNFDEALKTIDALINNKALSAKQEGLLSIKARIESMRDVVKAQASTGSSNTEQITTTGFKGYVGGFDSRGKGTPEGDGKDKAMRKVADGFIGEIGSKKGSKSSTATSLKHWFSVLSDKELDKEVTNGIRSWSSINRGMVPMPKDAVIMLARNSEFGNKPLDTATKTRIAEEHAQGSSFVVGDMPGVDSAFIDYLDEIGASYKIYHTGSIPRIQKGNVPTAVTAKQITAPTVGYTGTPEQLKELKPASGEVFKSNKKIAYRNKVWNESNDDQKRSMLQALEGDMDKRGWFNPKNTNYEIAANEWVGVPFAKSPNADKTIKKPPVLDFKGYFNRLEAVMDSKLDAAKLKVSDVHTVNMVQSLLGLDTEMESFGMFNPKTKEVYYADLAKFMEITKGVDGLTKLLYKESKEQIESDEYRDYLLESLEIDESTLTNKELFAMLVKDTVDTLEKSIFEQSIRLHEKIHGVVYDYVKENPESVEAKYIDKLYKTALNLAKKKPELFANVEEMADGTMYWQTDVQEFITEATTNPELVKVLASVDMEGNKVNITESLLDKLVKLMRKIIGLDNSIHTALLGNILAIAEKQNVNRTTPNQVHVFGSDSDIPTLKKWKNKQADTKPNEGIMGSMITKLQNTVPELADKIESSEIKQLQVLHKSIPDVVDFAIDSIKGCL